jgi:DNA adenine methylase
MDKANPLEIIDELAEIALQNIYAHTITDKSTLKRVKIVARCLQNRAGVRLLLSALLAKIHNPTIDIRRPYTEIPKKGTYSGRHYDEAYITKLIEKYNLPCNSTTAFLTPAFRNINQTLTLNMEFVGRPKIMYTAILELLNDVHVRNVKAEKLFVELLRELFIISTEKDNRMESLLENLRHSNDVPLSTEQIITLLCQQLKCKGASRLPVLIVAAAYNAAQELLREKILPLKAHNAADEQTGALGDIEITLIDDDEVVTSYEMKLKQITMDDISRALQKLEGSSKIVDNYIFITTEKIDYEIEEYLKGLYDKTKGIEFAILDCIEFIKYFLHLFHRIRVRYLDEYQNLLLAEPDSAVSQPLKEVFLSLRQQAESNNN